MAFRAVLNKVSYIVTITDWYCIDSLEVGSIGALVLSVFLFFLHDGYLEQIIIIMKVNQPLNISYYLFSKIFFLFLFFF